MKLISYHNNIFKRAIILFSILFYGRDLVCQTIQDWVKGNLIQFNDNGAWCWFQDERAIIDISNQKLIIGSVANPAGFGGSNRNGAVEVVIFDLNSRTPKRYKLAQLTNDDHNAPALIIRPDGKYLALYSDHYDKYKNRYRIFDGNSWSSEQAYDWTERPGGTDYTIAYNNVYYLSAENRMYNFTRANHRAPNFIISDNWGESWQWGGKLATNSSNTYNKGYYKYWSNAIDRIDFVFTEQHPRDTLTSIYHGYIQDGKVFNSEGIMIDPDIFDTSFIPTYKNFTKVFADGTIIGKDTLRRCWQADLVRYKDGTIATIITARTSYGLVGGYSNDPNINPQHAFVYCRFDGLKWSYTYLCKAGYKLTSSEADYVGLAALCPDDPNTIFISTHFDPRNDSALAKREIFMGTTNDNGQTWRWQPITWNSSRDNFRPIVPAWDENHRALLWFRGTYNSASSYDAAVVGVIEEAYYNQPLMTYVDADLNNTTLSNGSALTVTGPSSTQGPADNQWHLRTGYGNNGTVLTSSEIRGENAPLLKTRITIPQPGIYDVWVNFWANPTADWRIKAGLSPEAMQVYRHIASKQVDQNAHVNSIILSGDGNTFLYQAYVGRVSVTQNYFDVYIDDDATQTGSVNLIGNTTRTWYDGISYAPVVLFPFSPIAQLATPLIDFGKVQIGKTVYDSLLITNLGSDTLVIKSLSVNNPSFQILTQVPFTLEPGGSNFIYLAFTPSNPALQTDYLIIDHNAPSSPDSVLLQGEGELISTIGLNAPLPTKLTLLQNYPNPFNSNTIISFALPKSGKIKLTILDLTGKEIAVLVDQVLDPGYHYCSWNSQNSPSGVYFYKLVTDNEAIVKKMLLVK